MNELNSLLGGFAAALTFKHLGMCFLGVLMGQVVGVLPGIGPAAAIALLLPLTFGTDPTSAIILFAGIYYGSQYGGTLTSVLVSVPGESSTVMTSIDGYQMALQGRAGPALGIAAIGSFIAGTLGTLGLTLLAPALAKAALAFGPPEYFALVLLGLTALAAVGSGVVKGLVAGVAGLLMGTIGIDPQNGIARFDFGRSWLLDGIEFIVLTVALFGVGEIQDEYDWEERPVERLRDGSLVVDGTLSAADLRASYHIPIPESAEFETVAGFMLEKLGTVPRGGEFVDLGGHRLTVVDVEKNRISKVKIDKIPVAVAVKR